MSRENLHVHQHDFPVPVDAAGWQQRSLIVGIVGAVLCAIGAFLNLDQFLRGYLIAYVFFTGLTVGCLALLMVQYLTGGLWALVIRRPLEAAVKCLPLIIVLFLPLLIGKNILYAWMTNPALTAHNHWYLNMPFWYARQVLYFALWTFWGFTLIRRGDQQDRPLGTGVQLRFQGFSGVGLVVYALTISFAAVDWVMSLDPTWGSTIYGLIFLAGQGISALCFSIIILTVLTRYSPFREIVKPAQFHDIGKLTLAFVMLFAYFSFSQWLIIWSGNLPDEIGWYLQRIRGGWGYIIVGIVLFHFVLPFVLLLSRDLKRAGRRLVPVALLLIFLRLVDIYWYVIPNFPNSQAHLYFSIWYLIAPVGVGGLWLAYFFYNLRQRQLLPVYEPQLSLLLEQGSGHGH